MKINNLPFIIATIFLVIVTVFLFAVIFHYCIPFYKKRKLNKLKLMLGLEKRGQIKSSLLRIQKIVSENKQHKTDYKNAKLRYEKVCKYYFEINDKLEEMEDLIEGQKLKSFLKNAAKIKKLSVPWFENVRICEKISEKLLLNEQVIRNELILMNKYLRKILNFHQNNKKYYIHISEKINNLSSKIDDDKKEIDKTITAGEFRKAQKFLEIYYKTILKLAKIIRDGIKIHNYLYNKIPEIFISLQKEADKFFKKNIKYLQYVNFRETILDIKKRHEEAINEYKNLNLEKVKNLILNILRPANVLNNLAKLETESQDFLKNICDSVKSEIVLMKKNISILKQRGTKIFKNKKPDETTKNYFLSLLKLEKKLKFYKAKLDEMKTSEYPSWSVKVMHIRKWLIEMKKNVDKINYCNYIMIKISNDIKKNKNKILYSNLLMRDILNKVKKSNLILSDEDKTMTKTLFNGTTKLLKKFLRNLCDNEDKIKIDKMKEIVDEFYKKILEKYSTSKIVFNLIHAFSNQRALKIEIHQKMNLVENFYLSGEYDKALKTLLKVLEVRYA